jgi:D-Tyr-tRNAtyr deacylase
MASARVIWPGSSTTWRRLKVRAVVQRIVEAWVGRGDHWPGLVVLLAVGEVGGALLLVSLFTLWRICVRGASFSTASLGRRPSRSTRLLSPACA